MSSFASSSGEASKENKNQSSISQQIKIITPSTSSPWGSIGRTFVLSAVALFSKALLGMFNSTTVSNHETFLRAVTREDRGVDDNDDDDKKKRKKPGLITVANHHSTFDDPGVLA